MNKILKPFFPMLALGLLLASAHARADEIDRIKEKVKAFYDENIPKYHKIAANSHLAAEKEIQGQDEATLVMLKTALMKAINPNIENFNAIDDCLDDAAALYGAIRAIQGQEPADPVARANFRINTYDYPTMSHTFDLVSAYQKNYAACYQAVQQAEMSLRALAQLKSLQLNLCEIGKTQNAEAYNRVLATNEIPSRSMSKLDAKFFTTWPSITLTMGQRLDCVAGGLDGAQDKKEEPKPMDPMTPPKDDGPTTCTYGSLEAQNNNQLATDSWAQLRAGSPYLVGAAFYSIATSTTIFGKSALTASSATGWAAVVVVATELVLATYENYENKRRVEKINDYIDQKEREIREIREKEYISFAQFEALRRKICPSTQTKFDEDLQTRLAPIDTQKGLDTILDYRKVSDDVSLWFGDLFNFLVKGNKGAFVDKVIADELQARKAEFYSSIYDAKASQNLAAEVNKINTVQAEISDQRCMNLTVREKFLTKQAMRTRIQQFKDTCSLQTRAFANVTAPLLLDTGSSSGITCDDERLDSPFRKIEIQSASDGSRLLVRGAGDQILADLSGVNSGNLIEKTSAIGGLRCEVTGTVDGGAATRLKAAVYEFGPSPLTEGLGVERRNNLLTTLGEAQKRIHRKATICKKQLIEVEPVALDPTLCNSIAF